MMMQSRRVVAAGGAALVSADDRVRAESARGPDQDALVRDALARYQAGLDAIQNGASAGPSRRRRPKPAGPIRDIRLTDVVELALAEEPRHRGRTAQPAVRRSADCRPSRTRICRWPRQRSGQRDNYQLPRDQLQGGQRVSIATTTYNAGVAQNVPMVRRQLCADLEQQQAGLVEHLRHLQPDVHDGLDGELHAAAAARARSSTRRGSSWPSRRSTARLPKRRLRATVTQTLANVRNAYWDLVFARSAVDVAQRALQLADKLVEDNKARVEVGTLAPLDIVQAEAESANRRQAVALAEATLQTAELALKRFIVSGTEDPLWRQELRPVDLPSLEPAPTDIEGAVRRSLERRTDLVSARKNLQSSDISLRYFRNETLPEVDLDRQLRSQGIGGTSFRRDRARRQHHRHDSRAAITDALRLLTNRDYPNWNLQFNVSYNLFGSQADAQYARARVQRNQSQARLRALELQVATEVTNAALSVQSNLKRVEAAVAARELAEKRLEAEQSKFEVGMSTNFFVVQAQRDLRDAQNVELRALADYRKSLVDVRARAGSPCGRWRRRSQRPQRSHAGQHQRSIAIGYSRRVQLSIFMRKFLIIGLVVAVAGAAAYFGFVKREQPAAAAGQAQAGPGGQQRRRWRRLVAAGWAGWRLRRTRRRLPAADDR